MDPQTGTKALYGTSAEVYKDCIRMKSLKTLEAKLNERLLKKLQREKEENASAQAKQKKLDKVNFANFDFKMEESLNKSNER